MQIQASALRGLWSQPSHNWLCALDTPSPSQAFYKIQVLRVVILHDPSKSDAAWDQTPAPPLTGDLGPVS